MLIEKIYAKAQLASGKVALVCNNKPVSYRIFARCIDAARRYLTAQQISGTGVVVLAMASQLDVWFLGLALRSLGLTTIAVSSTGVIGRLGLVDVKCVITTEAARWQGLEELCAGTGWRLLIVSRAIFADCAVGPAPQMPDLSASEGGQILLTSGTTGIYKKVLITPSCQAAQSLYRQRVFGISDRSVVNLLNFGGWAGTGPNNAIATWDAGGTVVIYSRPNLHESFRYRGITHTQTVPPTLANILSAPADALRRDDAMQLTVTGGSLSRALWEKAKMRLTRRVYTSIGSTEGLPITRTAIEGPDDLRWHRILPSSDVQIVDDRGRIVSVGQEGMVRFRPLEGVSGYLDDPEATRAFFRDGYFYSGDLGVIRSDGRLALLGRLTDVINVVGEKVAAGPIEEVLQSKLGIGGVCVFSIPHADGEEVVHVVIESLLRIDHAQIAAVLKGMLPRYASRVQAHYVEALPRNDMGKIQRNVLKQRLGLSADDRPWDRSDPGHPLSRNLVDRTS
jgi:acyl-coenzyme A synthetase/AMP-(fatty) acid ligase